MERHKAGERRKQPEQRGVIISCLHTGRALAPLGLFYSPAIVCLVYIKMSGLTHALPFLLTDC